MSQQKLLARVVQVFDEHNIQYMLTGSVASSLHGEPRSTHDIDIVVAITKSSSQTLVDAFPPPDFYLDKASIISAIEEKGMFNLIDASEGDKVDFWILTDEPFDQSRFARRISEELVGVKVHVTAPEDIILAKLKWAKESGGSQKHFTDALRVYEVQHDVLDRRYLERWAKELHIEDLWKRLTEEAEFP